MRNHPYLVWDADRGVFLYPDPIGPRTAPAPGARIGAPAPGRRRRPLVYLRNLLTPASWALLIGVVLGSGAFGAVCAALVDWALS